MVGKDGRLSDEVNYIPLLNSREILLRKQRLLNLRLCLRLRGLRYRHVW